MIVDNILYFAIFVFIMLIIGLVLTVLEFSYGQPKKQQQVAEKYPDSVADFRDSTTGRPAR